MNGRTKWVAKLAVLPLALGGLFFTAGAFSPSAETAEAHVACRNQTLHLGSSGHCVRHAQRVLRQWGYYRGSISGRYKTDMRHAVWNLQRRSGGYLRVTGVVDRRTWNYLTCDGLTLRHRSLTTVQTEDGKTTSIRLVGC